LAGVEPASIHGDHMLSTCLVMLNFRDLSAAEQPNKPLFPVFLVIRPEKSSDQPRIACVELFERSRISYRYRSENAPLAVTCL
jgi:hypothetical protein